MTIRAKDQCPFCSIPIKSYTEFVKHMENAHPDDYLMITYDNGVIEIIQSGEIDNIEKVEKSET
ncbi:MAG: hypothetical protein ACW99A_07385 [Candidatus Kariarchaeaceae archaeon]